MTESPDLFAFVVRLRPEQGGPPPQAHGHQIQALFLELVRQIDPELANRLHAEAASKPFTVAALPAPTHGRDPAPLELRVTLADQRIFGPFTAALLRQTARPALRLGSTALRIEEVCGTPGSHPWAGYAAFAQLAGEARPAPSTTLRFATPAAFGLGTRANGKPRHGLLPAPEAVFGSLARRWNQLCPPPLQLDMAMVQAACADTMISSTILETVTFPLGKAPQKGFVGSCTYELPLDDEQARAIALLADAAFYLGLGVKTTRGMGLCRRQPAARTVGKR